MTNTGAFSTLLALLVSLGTCTTAFAQDPSDCRLNPLNEDYRVRNWNDDPSLLKSYYAPNRGTLNIWNGCVPKADPLLTLVSGTELPRDIIIQEEQGFRVFRMTRGGKISWEHQERRALIYDLRVYKTAVGFLTEDKYVTLDIESGNQLDRQTVNAAIGYRCYDTVVACLQEIPGSRRGYVQVLRSGHRVPAKGPRHAVVQGEILYVADSEAKEVFAYDLINKAFIWRLPSYWPNSLEFMNDRELLVTEEHANRVVAIDIHTRQRRIIHGCKIGPYKDIAATNAQFEDWEGKTAESTKPSGRGVCQEDAAGDNLYSPNGATFTDDGYLISDTDNHRVLYVRNGRIIAFVSNLNNPINAFFVPIR